MLLEREQIDEHLQILSAEKSRVIKVFFSGFVIHDAVVCAVFRFIQIDAVNKAGYHALTGRRMHPDRRHSVLLLRAAREMQLAVTRDEF